ncbi:MAG: PIG-L family deacetylase, partial [Chlorobi bacterium]|nr:PIG-L family deacetylase [Chlorobiota bacterium]
MTLDVIAIGAHPDDVELCTGGTLAQLVAEGYRVGIVDCTRGEQGTRGNAQRRMEEARQAQEILGVH